MRRIYFIAAAFCFLTGTLGASAQTFEATGRLQFLPATIHRTAHKKTDVPTAVVWLEPLPPQSNLQHPASTPKTYGMTQKDKQFHPRFLVVPVGSLVSFPNKDPFFHNVFSLFNGKRFDLGLYEEGSTRAVKFSLPGVSYIFCNIHPEMSTVIVALDTPYFATPDATGHVVIHGVPGGTYRLNIWAEGATSQSLAALARTLRMSPGNTSLGHMTIQRTQNFPVDHKNKFGRNYDEHPPVVY